MLGRLLEITKNGQYLKCKFGVLEVYDVTKDLAEKKGDCPLDDIVALIILAQRVRYDNDLITALGDKGVPIVFCGDKFIPKSVILPLDCNFEQARRMDAQLDASKPLKKRIWAEVVRKKIQTQVEVLQHLNLPCENMIRLSNTVLSGDPDNNEAQAAAYYFKQIFGKEFVRDRNESGTNALLNYGYTIVRAAMLRCILASGLHPSLGIFHRSYTNTFRLADDLMEPFRPLVDLRVSQLMLEYSDVEGITPEIKKKLAALLYFDVPTASGTSLVLNCMYEFSTSLAMVYLNMAESLNIPKKLLPLKLINWANQ